MARLEFSKKTKRDALERSQMRCEASGPLYGLEEGQRCSIPLSNGVSSTMNLPRRTAVITASIIVRLFAYDATAGKQRSSTHLAPPRQSARAIRQKALSGPRVQSSLLVLPRLLNLPKPFPSNSLPVSATYSVALLAKVREHD